MTDSTFHAGDLLVLKEPRGATLWVSMNNGDFRILTSEIPAGVIVVLENDSIRYYVKILTSQGTGWVHKASLSSAEVHPISPDLVLSRLGTGWVIAKHLDEVT